MRRIQPLCAWGGVKIKLREGFDVLTQFIKCLNLRFFVFASETKQTREKFFQDSQKYNVLSLKRLSGLPQPKGFAVTKKSAFTLSEVLITLVVIGIVAAITVPTLYANYQDKALKSALTKNYSVLKQVFERYYFINGERFNSSDYGSRFLKDLFKQEVNVMKDCGYDGRGKKPCLEDTVAKTYKSYNGNSSVSGNMFDDGHIVLNDGSYFMWENSSNWNMIISVDVNGPGKKPNRLGKDLFMFQILKDGTIKPMGEKGTSYLKETYCSSTSSHNMNGAGCTTKVLGKNKST